MKDNITISELSSISGIPPTTIRFYLREGLITPPLKKGKTRAYYNKEHIMQLKNIKKLQGKGKLSLVEIKNIVEYSPAISDGNKSILPAQSDRKQDIKLSAIDMFRSKAYDSISIRDITEKAGISNNTFYKYYSNKEDLFFDCADQVCSDIVNNSDQIIQDSNPIQRIKLRALLFITVSRRFIDMLNIARGISPAAMPHNKARTKLLISNLAKPVTDDLETGINQGKFKKIDTFIISHLLIGSAEYGTYYLKGKTKSEKTKFIETSIDLFVHGFKPGTINHQYAQSNPKTAPVDNVTNYYKMSELSKKASTPATTIRYYINQHLLPQPIIASTKSAVYTDDHLNRLKLIKMLQTEEGQSLSSIKKNLKQLPVKKVPADAIVASSKKQHSIMAAAIDLFIEKGLRDTSIDDIVNRAKIGKGTFYAYFKNKDELFINSADLAMNQMYNHVWHEIKDERDLRKRIIKRGDAFIQSYPKWAEMMNLIRYSATVTDNELIKEKFKDVLNKIITPIAHDLENMQKAGIINKKFDCYGTAHLLMGMAEYGAWLVHECGYDAKEILAISKKILDEGITKQAR